MKLVANVDFFEGVGYVASIVGMKGMVVSAPTKKELAKELSISILVKMAHDYKMDISTLQEFELSPTEAEIFEEHLLSSLPDNGKAKLELKLATSC